jgi:hypothetical protein
MPEPLLPQDNKRPQGHAVITDQFADDDHIL